MDGERERLRQYLLGGLPAAQSEQITDRVFSDEAFAAAVEETERDLFDAYARGELNDVEEEQLRRRLLTSDAQRDKLRFSQAWVQRRKPGFPVSPWLIVAAAAAVVAVAWLAMANRKLNTELATLRLSQNKRVEARGGPTPPFVSFLIAPASRGDGMPSLQVPKSAELVRLDFELPAGATGRRDLAITSAGGATIFGLKNIPVEQIGGGSYISAWLPARALPSGLCEALVSSGPNARDTLSYPLEIR